MSKSEEELDDASFDEEQSPGEFASSEEDDHWRDSEDEDVPSEESTRTGGGSSSTSSGSTNYVFILVIVAGILCAVLPIWFKPPDELPTNQPPAGSASGAKCLPKGEKLFTSDELAQYTDKPKILLGFLGVVYDVTGGSYYAPDGSYHFFAGKDGTRAFLTGEFAEKELYDDISDLDASHLSGIDTWLNLYDEKYKRVGRLVGSYYDSNGCETKKLGLVRKRIKAAKSAEEDDKTELSQYPPCNSEYDNTKKSGRVWCSTASGGIQRSWTGKPRQLYVLASKSWRCACLREDGDVAADDWCDGTKATGAGDSKSGVKYAPDGKTPNCLWKHYSDCDAQATECPFQD